MGRGKGEDGRQEKKEGWCLSRKERRKTEMGTGYSGCPKGEKRNSVGRGEMKCLLRTCPSKSSTCLFINI